MNFFFILFTRLNNICAKLSFSILPQIDSILKRYSFMPLLSGFFQKMILKVMQLYNLVSPTLKIMMITLLLFFFLLFSFVKQISEINEMREKSKENIKSIMVLSEKINQFPQFKEFIFKNEDLSSTNFYYFLNGISQEETQALYFFYIVITALFLTLVCSVLYFILYVLLQAALQMFINFDQPINQAQYIILVQLFLDILLVLVVILYFLYLLHTLETNTMHEIIKEQNKQIFFLEKTIDDFTKAEEELLLQNQELKVEECKNCCLFRALILCIAFLYFYKVSSNFFS